MRVVWSVIGPRTVVALTAAFCKGLVRPLSVQLVVPYGVQRDLVCGFGHWLCEGVADQFGGRAALGAYNKTALYLV